METVRADLPAAEEEGLRALVGRLLAERGSFRPTAFSFADVTVWVDQSFLDAAQAFKGVSGQHFSIKKALGEIVRSIAAVFSRHALSVCDDGRFLLLAHPRFAAETRAQGRMFAGIVADRYALPDGSGHLVLFDDVVVRAWDIGTIVHELVHVFMRDTDAERQLLGDRHALELFTDCLAAEAVEGCSWRAHYRGGDYIAAVRAEDGDFSPAAFVAETCARLAES